MSKEIKFVPLKEGQDLDPQQTVDVKNPELEEMLADYSKDKTSEKLNKLLVMLHNSRVLSPMSPGPNKKPFPVLLKADNGLTFLPIYTSKEQFKDVEKIPMILNVPFEQVNRLGADEHLKIEGMVINPFTTNLVLKKELLQHVAKVDEDRKNGKLQPKAMKLTAEQYYALMRKQFEFGALPKKLFEDGETFMQELSDRKAEYIDELYEDAYQEKRMYPYLPEEFAVMVMDINESLMVASIDLPARYFTIPCCQRVYIAWNPETKQAHYYTIEMTKEKDKMLLGEFTKDLKRIDHGVAPVEGAELQAIIDLCQEESFNN